MDVVYPQNYPETADYLCAYAETLQELVQTRGRTRLCVCILAVWVWSPCAELPLFHDSITHASSSSGTPGATLPKSIVAKYTRDARVAFKRCYEMRKICFGEAYPSTREVHRHLAR